MPKSAFTLIEMLVVLAILAILTSLAFGTLGVVRKLAESTNCLTNLSQMPFASIAYTQENRFLWPSTTSSQGIGRQMFGVRIPLSLPISMTMP